MNTTTQLEMLLDRRLQKAIPTCEADFLKLIYEIKERYSIYPSRQGNIAEKAIYEAIEDSKYLTNAVVLYDTIQRAILAHTGKDIDNELDTKLKKALNDLAENNANRMNSTKDNNAANKSIIIEKPTLIKASTTEKLVDMLKAKYISKKPKPGGGFIYKYHESSGKKKGQSETDKQSSTTEFKHSPKSANLAIDFLNSVWLKNGHAIENNTKRAQETIGKNFKDYVFQYGDPSSYGTSDKGKEKMNKLLSKWESHT